MKDMEFNTNVDFVKEALKQMVLNEDKYNDEVLVGGDVSGQKRKEYWEEMNKATGCKAENLEEEKEDETKKEEDEEEKEEEIVKEADEPVMGKDQPRQDMEEPKDVTPEEVETPAEEEAPVEEEKPEEEKKPEEKEETPEDNGKAFEEALKKQVVTYVQQNTLRNFKVKVDKTPEGKYLVKLVGMHAGDLDFDALKEGTLKVKELARSLADLKDASVEEAKLGGEMKENKHYVVITVPVWNQKTEAEFNTEASEG